MNRGDVQVRSVQDTRGAWQRVVEEVSQSNLAHSPEWFTIIRKAYGHDPLYLTAEDDGGRVVGLLPAFIVRRPLFGTVVSSMPFLDTGGPCSSSAAITRALVDHLIADARRVGASTLELRCKERLQVAQRPFEDKVSLALRLPADPDCLWRQVDGTIRNQIRKAERSGLSVEFGTGDQLMDFYDSFAVRMRELGSPVHAFGFLRAVLDSFGTRARIALVRKGSRVVGGLVALAFKDTLTVPWASCLKEYFSLCPNMLLYWETLRTACREGFSRFDFGRSSRDSGTYHFKRQWGAHEEPLFWYTIPVNLRCRSLISSTGPERAFLSDVWRRLPLSLTKHLGPPIRKYLTQ